MTPAQILELLTRQLADANRELERWRHGVTIEGDFVCPDSLALSDARAELRAIGKAKLELRALADAATPGPWFARGRHLSRVPNDSGMGATLHTNHIGVMAEREDAAFIAAARTLEPLLAAGVLDLTRQLAEALAGNERLRETYKRVSSVHADRASRTDDLQQRLATAREALREACDLLAIARLGDSPPLREQADVIRKRGGL